MKMDDSHIHDNDSKSVLLRELYLDSGEVSERGMKALSLNDIIRFMAYLRIPFDIINTICKFIS